MHQELDAGHLIECKLTPATQSPSTEIFFALCDPVTFCSILHGKPGLMMDYPNGKFGDCSFSHFGSIMQITDTHTQTWMNTLLLLLSSARVNILYAIYIR